MSTFSRTLPFIRIDGGGGEAVTVNLMSASGEDSLTAGVRIYGDGISHKELADALKKSLGAEKAELLHSEGRECMVVMAPGPKGFVDLARRLEEIRALAN